MHTKKRNILIAIIILIVLTVSIIIAVLNHDILRAVFGSEKVGMYEIAAMIECKSENESNIIFAVDDIQVPFPLPNGAVEFENAAYPAREGSTQYLVTADAWKTYQLVTLPQCGFEFDQMGAWIEISNADNSMRVGMHVSMFSISFLRIEVTKLS
ncbi:MAG: hypothetical protein FWF10_06500 [Clostridiales bacterium]|nr:hypothetical protein [Clostridiales bacterium]